MSPGNLRVGRGTGDGRRKGRNLGVFEGWEAGEVREITQQCLIFRNRKRAQGRNQSRSRSRECMVQVAGGLDRLSPPYPR